MGALHQSMKKGWHQGGIIKFASWEPATFFKYFAQVSVNFGVSKQCKWTQLTSSVHNKTINILFDYFQLKYIHIYTNFVKIRDSN